MLNFSSEQSRFDMRLGYYDAKRVLYGLYGSSYCIDRTLDEQAAYNRLLEMARIDRPDAALREINESLLPELIRKAGCKSVDYYDAWIAIMEKAAVELAIDPFAIVTDTALLDAIRARAASVSRNQQGPFTRRFPLANA